MSLQKACMLMCLSLMNDASHLPASALFKVIFFKKKYIMIGKEVALVRVSNEVIPCRCYHKIKCFPDSEYQSLCASSD